MLGILLFFVSSLITKLCKAWYNLCQSSTLYHNHCAALLTLSYLTTLENEAQFCANCNVFIRDSTLLTSSGHIGIELERAISLSLNFFLRSPSSHSCLVFK